ncbi:MAG: hypothetical protein AAGD11_10815 [Planctomycetota bacterium]
MAQSKDSVFWSLDGHHARFSATEFGAVVNLLDPAHGLAEIRIGDINVEGFALGVCPIEHVIRGTDEIADAYVRGTDLVVTYAQTDERPFELEVYWRIGLLADDVVQLDGIVSLQTCLLETFPQFHVRTNLPAQLASGLQVGILLRGTNAGWSYAEHARMRDPGALAVDDSDNATLITITRQLGGQFLEKGVIRRLQIRGLFLPRENDDTNAAKRLASLAVEEPPLTV